ncbi:MAG: inositol-3-phosphate synthase [Chloroflexota bacterium]|nr:inositol-3-phosphate synthase [Chloroflexota bacterium]
MRGEERPARPVGVAVVGLGGAVATTAVAGVELLKLGRVGTEGLPLADLPAELAGDLADYGDLVFAGWNLSPDDLRRAAEEHRVLPPAQLAPAAGALAGLRPWPAVGSAGFCRNIDGENRIAAPSHRAAVEVIREDLRRFRREGREGDAGALDGLVMVNLASTERRVDPALPQWATIDRFEAALDADDPEIGPAMLYAYAALRERVPYVNFTPSVAVDIPALTELAACEGVPVGGKDGKTGQTMLKTVIAPALRTRALRVDGWYSANILGNRDGLALDDKDSLASKITTKGSALDHILGYRVENHIVDIRYYRPRGDNKESWDNIDVTGFLGQPMQIKVNFLCRDSILAAPLTVELARLLDLAGRRGCAGVQEQLGLFFKAPMTAQPEAVPEHALHRQEAQLLAWLASMHAREGVAGGGASADQAIALPLAPASLAANGVTAANVDGAGGDGGA